MHDNTYIYTKDSRKLLDEIVTFITNNKKTERDFIKEWSIRYYSGIHSGVHIPPLALIVSTINNEEKRTCISLHAYPLEEKENGKKDKNNYIVVTPHFWTDYAWKNECPNQELEDLLKRFDEFMTKHFSDAYDEIELM